MPFVSEHILLLELIFLELVIIVIVSLYAKSIRLKLQKLKEKKTTEDANSQSNIDSQDKSAKKKTIEKIESPIQFLQNELLKTKNTFLKRTNFKSVSFQKDLSKEDKILFLRSTYLHAECSAFPQRESSDKYFRVISSLLNPILNQMIDHNSSGELKTKDNQIELLREKISHLQNVEKENNSLSFELAKSRNIIDKNQRAKEFDNYIKSTEKMSDIQSKQNTSFIEIKSSMTRVSESDSSGIDKDHLKSKLKKLEDNLSKSENQIIELTKKLVQAKQEGSSTNKLNQDIEDLRTTNKDQKTLVDEIESNIQNEEEKESIEKLKATIKEFTGCVEILENEVDYLQEKLDFAEQQESSHTDKDYDILEIIKSIQSSDDILELSESIKIGLEQIGVNSIFKIISSRDTIKADSSGVFSSSEKSLLSSDNSETESPHNVAEGVKLFHDATFTLLIKYKNRDDEPSLIKEIKNLHDISSHSIKNIDRKLNIITLKKKTKKILEKTRGKLTDIEIKSAFHQEEIHKTYSIFAGEIKKKLDSGENIEKIEIQESLTDNQERIALLFSVGDVVERQYESIGDGIRDHLDFIESIDN